MTRRGIKQRRSHYERGSHRNYFTCHLNLLCVYNTKYCRPHNQKNRTYDGCLPNAVEQTLDNMKEEQYESREQMAEAFVRDLKTQITSDADIEVEIIGADHIHGLLDVNVRETFLTSDGKKKTIEVRKTAVLEQFQEEA